MQVLGHEHEREDVGEPPFADAPDRREDDLRDSGPEHHREAAIG